MSIILNKLNGFWKSPIVRISFGLTMLAVSLLLIFDLMGFMPNTSKAELEYRTHIAQSAAVQVSLEIGERDTSKILSIIESIQQRDDRVESVAVKRVDGSTLYSAGNHAFHWTLPNSQKSTMDNIRVALFSPKGSWGSVEIAYKPHALSASLFKGGNAVIYLIMYVAVAGFIGFYFFLKRVMRELDPSQVLPDRVKTALDTLADGLLIVNEAGHIMFSNDAMSKRIGIHSKKLMGKECNSLDWEIFGSDEHEGYPWESVLSGEMDKCEMPIKLSVGYHQHYQFVTTVTPIRGAGESIRGALITFNDVTEVEKKRAELEQTLVTLEESKSVIEAKNRELFTLATRDPLTNVFNRRAFFDAFETIFESTLARNGKLGCIMVDIDHFKSVNDNFGHSVGDTVILYVAQTLVAEQQDLDVVGRFGGEEFCILLPDTSLDETKLRAETIRGIIERGEGADFSSQLSITASFGIACLPGTAQVPTELVDLADRGLYQAKNQGRNRVIAYNPKTAESDTSSQDRRIKNKASDSNAGAGVGEQSKASPDRMDYTDQPSAAHARVENNRQSDFELVRPAKRRRDDIEKVIGAKVLSEAEPVLSQRELLVSNIETATKRAKRFGHSLAVLVFDGTSLQQIADTVNRTTAVKVSSVLVDRVKNTLRSVDIVSQQEMITASVAPSENFELAVLISDIDSDDSVPGIVERVLSVYEQHIAVNSNEYYVDIAIGVSLFGVDGDTSEQLLNNANLALTQARSIGKGSNYSFYSSEVDQVAKRQLRLQSDLHQVIERDELEVHYQPKMDLQTGDLLGFEALLRWNHTQFGMVSPMEFIPLAERSGLITHLNRWVINEVADQLQRWRASGYLHYSVAVNMSAVDLEDPELAYWVLSALADRKIPPHALEVEITESLGIDELEMAQLSLNRLHKAGVVVSIDDFGTGYASLSYLQKFPVSRLKIDRLFVDGCTEDHQKARVVRSIVTMGNSLGLRVLAEGVETEEQLVFLRDHHCDEIQGYYVSKPVNSTVASGYLENPHTLSQVILAADAGSRLSPEETTRVLSINGLDAIITPFSEPAILSAANEPAGSGHAHELRPGFGR